MIRALARNGSATTGRLSRQVVARPAVRSFSTTHRREAEIEVFVDGKPVMIEQGAALIQACEKAGVDIPRFCYHERLAVAGNCRMCLVEVERSPKPVASCAFPAAPGMKIKTDTPLVKKAREGVMEFLLANHPLDCPICDQGGECDLQDQSVRYGADRGRFSEFVGKRAVEDKNFGPLIRTEMTRCIHCTRCVRFANEVAGAVELGTSGRGNDMQIGTYVEKMIDSEMSGNVIDLCPVGALTSKPYAFTARPWELRNTESVDVMDAVGSSIRVDSRGLEVMRVLPRLNEEINEEWISDKTRFAYDGLKRQRLTAPLVRRGDKFTTATWPEALELIAARMSETRPEEMRAVAGQDADAESMVALKDLFNRLGSERLTVEGPRGSNAPAHGVDLRANYLFNTTLAGADEADLLLLVGTNPRHEAAVLNARLRKAYLENGMDVALIGEPAKLNYEYEHLGADAAVLEEIVSGKHPFAKRLASANRPMIIVGSGVTEHENAAYVYGTVAKLVSQHKDKFLRDDWNGYNVLQRAAGRIAAYDIGFVSASDAAATAPAKFVYLLNADEITSADAPKDAFVVYQGHHGDRGAHLADVILPGIAYTEKDATFVNTEGRAQMTRAAVSPPGAAREDWQIIRAISEVTGRTLPYDDVHTLRHRMAEISPSLVRHDVLETPAFAELGLQQLAQSVGSKPASLRPLQSVVSDFYLTDPISRASATMAKCSASFTHGESMAEAAGAQKGAAETMHA
ncbi:NADH dehydrogenase subunit [Thamnocephalis sphaerospora]|uniref:NADH-ubiquinone oxidoreductase 78 kDa subunit, mitochondrial n=1 Tax=Thamnocephalis sphaerospora TaxID=78915 RepID=A0A4P9XM35_9FUNG|nr:NADH dehydrogenase subunit [Thamnocephalis sphaerospora]|eukprot:RKP06925.1 NADH dehydrogenase subunit [Thamnocephalis sphaerospora]